MSIITAVRDYLLTYDGLKDGALVTVDSLGSEPTQYAVIPVPGARIVERYIDGSSRREFPFLIQSTESTADDLERIENSGFYEALADWFEVQTDAGNLPVLDTGKTATEIEAVNWAFVYQQGESLTGIYQITCKVVYEQSART
ncbi:MAG: hypothetical protein PHQ36_04230 [Anaerolineales bacterium]|nr:hypothetical protein [Anaerolineales bacterium]